MTKTVKHPTKMTQYKDQKITENSFVAILVILRTLEKRLNKNKQTKHFTAIT